MAEKIYLADKKTLDNVKQDTQYIKNQFPLQVSGGTDWRKYENLNIVAYPEAKANNEWETLFSIQGKGYINFLEATTRYQSCFSHIQKLRLKVDGKILYEVESKSGNMCYLCLMPFSKINDDDIKIIKTREESKLIYSLTQMTNTIFFNTNLILEQCAGVGSGGSGGNQCKPIQILGGIEK